MSALARACSKSASVKREREEELELRGRSSAGRNVVVINSRGMRNVKKR